MGLELPPADMPAHPGCDQHPHRDKPEQCGRCRMHDRELAAKANQASIVCEKRRIGMKRSYCFNAKGPVAATRIRLIAIRRNADPRLAT